MAPEYMMRGNYSVKSDAFSFGVMVLEIVTGRKNNSNNDGTQQSGDLLTTVSTVFATHEKTLHCRLPTWNGSR